MSLADISHESQLRREDLPYYHDLPDDERTFLWESAKDHLAEEMRYFEGQKIYKNMQMIAEDIRAGELVVVEPVVGLYGIANPIRSRYHLPSLPTEGSVPFIHKKAKPVLDAIAADVHAVGQQDSEFMEQLGEYGFTDFMIAVYSLTRTSPYQSYIAHQGRRFAVGSDGKEATSTHERAKAADIDHSGFYAIKGESGEIVTLNRDVPDREFALFGKLLPKYKAILAQVIDSYVEENAIMALHEIPNGWGGYHVAFKQS